MKIAPSLRAVVLRIALLFAAVGLPRPTRRKPCGKAGRVTRRTAGYAAQGAKQCAEQ